MHYFSPCFKNSYGFVGILQLIPFIFFGNGHIRSIVWTLPNVVKIDVKNIKLVPPLPEVVHKNVEIENINSTLLGVVNSNVDIDNIISTLI